jgi:hypothetical protein
VSNAPTKLCCGSIVTFDLEVCSCLHPTAISLQRCSVLKCNVIFSLRGILLCHCEIGCNYAKPSNVLERRHIYEHEPQIATDESFPYCEQCSWPGR